MTDPEESLSRMDAFFDSLGEFLRKNAFAIALIAPFVVIAVLPIGSAAVLVLLVIYLAEAMLYVFMRRGHRDGPRDRSGPGVGVQVLSGVLATIFILGGIAGLWSSSEGVPLVPILAIGLGIGIIALVWNRVSRASGDRTTALAGRMAGIVGEAGESAIWILALRLILAAAVAGVAWLIAAVTQLFD